MSTFQKPEEFLKNFIDRTKPWSFLGSPFLTSEGIPLNLALSFIAIWGFRSRLLQFGALAYCNSALWILTQTQPEMMVKSLSIVKDDKKVTGNINE